MEMITFPCTACKFVLKVGADKAGRNAKCGKCGAILKIPAASAAEPAAPPPPAPKKPADDDEEEGGMVYQLKEFAPQAEEQLQQAEAAKPKVLQTPGRTTTKKQAQHHQPRGMAEGRLRCENHCGRPGHVAGRVRALPRPFGFRHGSRRRVCGRRRQAPWQHLHRCPGKTGSFDLATYAIALVAGDSSTNLMMTVARLAQVLALLAYGPLLAGYVICLAVPDRFGTRLQLKVILGLALLNIISLIVFKLLPLFGVVRYTLLPFLVPEVAMLEMNAERTESLIGIWLKAPIIEVYLATLLTLLHYLEPAMIATFFIASAWASSHRTWRAKALKP